MKSNEDRHCSYCKHYECIQSRYMYCTKLQHRIYASRKNGCNQFEPLWGKLKVRVSDISSIIMSVNPPKVVEDAGYRVIHKGEIKRWVGIGWVAERKACKDDYYNIPEVINE